MIVAGETVGLVVPAGRRALRPCLKILMVHWTGVRDRAGPIDDEVEVRRVFAYGRSIGNPLEYNFVIGRQGTTYSQAGLLLGGHCWKLNTLSIGVLMNFGIGSTVDRSAACVAFSALRRHLVDVGALQPDHDVVPHYRYRATACCGDWAAPPGARWPSPTGQGQLGDVIPQLLD